MTDDDVALRKELELDGTVTIVAHPRTVMSLRNIKPHAIVHIADADTLDTCVTYTFGFLSREGYRRIALLDVFAGRDFMEWLVRAYLVPRDRPAEEGDIVLYFYNDVWKHIGTLVGKGRVRSKWGTFPVYEHGMWEIPASYGDRVILAQPLDPDDAYRLFLKYAAGKGIPKDVIELARRDIPA